MKALVNSFLIAFSMYSKIPVPRADWTKENMRYVMCFFPLVGVVIGAAVYLWNAMAAFLPVSNIFHHAVLAVIPLFITGGIHMDGLMDTADALRSYQPVEKKLEILKDPQAGAFAVITCVIYILLDFAVWYDITAKEIEVLAVGFVLSRALSGLAVVTFPLAKNSGLAATFSNEARKKVTRYVMICYIICCVTAMVWLDWKLGLIGIAGSLLVFGYYRYMSVKEFGGITGDLAGYFLQICELIMAICVVTGGNICG
ncbi:adenosylcobinamide-GDP ribazoletransferase [Anaeromicropila populeti]|uniref:Adenosylcobinamide-GDP ribazoletransferase n=1 Tax=Anaeromicropila populeti TaxID=37658 RepID=A0A1I6J0T7_9FIRM|nr:adenosylcobinamide-GDP ribazoletransferase [Anaeromicropila populeti]SFR72622.1 cobalamin-5'-phosphate synthase [Anaeromicropila populeti]